MTTGLIPADLASVSAWASSQVARAQTTFSNAVQFVQTHFLAPVVSAGTTIMRTLSQPVTAATQAVQAAAAAIRQGSQSAERIWASIPSTAGQTAAAVAGSTVSATTKAAADELAPVFIIGLIALALLVMR